MPHSSSSKTVFKSDVIKSGSVNAIEITHIDENSNRATLCCRLRLVGNIITMYLKNNIWVWLSHIAYFPSFLLVNSSFFSLILFGASSEAIISLNLFLACDCFVGGLLRYDFSVTYLVFHSYTSTSFPSHRWLQVLYIHVMLGFDRHLPSIVMAQNRRLISPVKFINIEQGL